jgi:cytochrome b561
MREMPIHANNGVGHICSHSEAGIGSPEQSAERSHVVHRWLMILLCVLPVLGLALLAARGYRGVLSLALLLLCPLGHLATMGLFGHRKG